MHLKEKKKSLNLEKDLLLTKEDFRAMSNSQPNDPKDLSSYLDFLDELWRAGWKRKLDKMVYPEPFRLK